MEILIVLGICFVVWMIIGIIRVSVSEKGFTDPWDFFCRFLMLDWLIHVILFLIEALLDS